jgi:tripartite-type tricarboxylate transporter receptor subunit TctC
MSIFSRLAQGAAFAALMTACLGAQAQHYPDRPVKVVVGMAPGGSNDIIARLISNELTARLGQAFVVENKPGANSTIATNELKRAAPDGTNLMLVISSHVTNMFLYPNLNYKLDDFKPVSVIADTPFVLVANPKFGPNNVAELIALAKASKEPIGFGTPGMGSTQHIAMELMDLMGGVKMNHVPYKGGAPAQTDTIAGVIPLIFATPTQSLPAVQAGQLKAIGVTSKQRISQLPNVPTLDESGLPGYEANVWFGIIAPKDTPDAIVAKLNKEIVDIVHSDKVRKQLIGMGLNPVGDTPQEFQALLDSEKTKWAEVIKKSNIQLQ